MIARRSSWIVILVAAAVLAPASVSGAASLAPSQARDGDTTPDQHQSLYATDSATPSYTFTDLGTLDGAETQAYGINNAGDVVGFSDVGGQPRAFLWDGTIHNLGTLPGGTISEAFSINDDGLVAGASDYSNGCCSNPGEVFTLWSDGTPADAGFGAAHIIQDTQINDSTLAAQCDDNHVCTRPIAGGETTDLGTLGGQAAWPHAINATGTVTGTSYITGDGATHAFRVVPGTAMEDLETLGGNTSTGEDVAPDGTVVGYSDAADGRVQAFLAAPGHAMADLGDLAGGTTGGEAFGINASGDVVGFSVTADGFGRATLWRNGAVLDLNTLIPAGSGVVLREAHAINDAGQIVGWAFSNSGGQPRGFLLTPVDTTPPSGTLTLDGGAAYGPRYTVTADVPASDPDGGTVSQVRLSSSGATTGGVLTKGVSQPYPSTPISFDVSDPATGGSASNGAHTVYAQWQDAAGNWSAPISQTITIDTVKPTVTKPPTQSFTYQTQLGQLTVPISQSWAATDATSGICSYALSEQLNGGAPQQVYQGGLTKVTRNLSPGSTYQYRLTAQDCAGNQSATAVGQLIHVGAVQQSAAAITYKRAWTTQTLSSAYGGSLKSATSKGASATLRWSGSNAAWIAPLGPTRGSAKVYVDGVLNTTVNLHAATQTQREIVFKIFASTAGPHTLRIVNAATKNHPRIDIDAFIVIS